MVTHGASLVAAVLAGVLELAAAVHAQAPSATVQGTAIDESAAIVPGVRVTVVNLDTGVPRTGRCDENGAFVISLLPPGRYQVTAEQDGFVPTTVTDLVLNVGDAIDLKLAMKVAGLETSVVVSAPMSQVSRSPAVGTVVDRQFVANLPLNGRSFQSLIAITPGVVMTAASSTNPGQFSVNGQRQNANYFTVDGVSANVAVTSGTAIGVAGAGAAPGVSVQGGTNSLVSIDALQEFKIETSTYAAEFGRTPGAQVSMVTRSGGNQYHGSLFEYFRDDELDAADYFVKRQNLAKPEQRQNAFGGVLGGPIRRNRTFAFVSYEGLRLDQPRSAVTEVPSMASRLAASAALRPYFDAFPVPNGPDTARGLARFSASYSDPSSLDATSVRIDHRLSDGLNLFARYNHAPSSGSSRLGSFSILGLNSIGVLNNKLQTLTAGATWIVSPAISNDLRVNWSRNAGENFQFMDTFGGATPVPATILHPSYAPMPSSFQLTLSGTNAAIANGLNSANVQRQFNVVNALLIARAAHQIKVGFDYRRFFPIYGPTSYVQSYVANGPAGLLAGTVTSASIAAVSSDNRYPLVSNFSAYAQDTWAATPSLTVSYGVRWEVNPPPSVKDSNIAISLTTADPASMTMAQAGTPMYRTTYNNIAPRLGASLRLPEVAGGELIVRGGWGVFFDLGSTATIDNLSFSFPFVARRAIVNPAFPVDPSLLMPPTIVPGGLIDAATLADPDLELPYTHQWNVAVEHALGASTTASVSYVGAAGHRLLRLERLVNPNPRFGAVSLGTNTGRSEYQSLQVKVARRLSSGLQALASYTLASSQDNISVDNVTSVASSRFDPEDDWGPSDFDIRHVFGAGVTYAIPSVDSSRAWRIITDGWSLDGVITARSAPPVNVVMGTTVFGVSNALRPDLVPNTPLYVDDAAVPGGWRFNRAAFVAPPLDASGNPLRQGTLERNALRGFAMSQVDLALRRDIPIHRGVSARLSVEAFNLFDQTSFAAPTNALSSGLFGQATRTLANSLGAGGIVGGGLNPLYQIGGPRSIQLAARLEF